MSERKSAVAHKIRRRNTILVLFTAIILIVVCLFTPLFDITDVSVIGNKILSEEDIVKASGIKKGSNLFLLNTGKSEERINSLGYVDSVEVKRKFLARIEIEITESVEAAYIAFAGNYVGIDSEGKILSITKSSKIRPKKAVVSGYALKNPQKGMSIEGKNEAKTKLLKKRIDCS
ncbi:MAG: FtsQ-type POTRA domain-containing protein [Clostridia bacterium]|nr:FtsQ-type POTRA domain-containing protein [Clostridia bacterium]